MKYIIIILFSIISISILSQKQEKENKEEKSIYTTEVDNPDFSFIGGALSFSMQGDRFASPIAIGGELFARFGAIYGGARRMAGVEIVTFYKTIKTPISSATNSLLNTSANFMIGYSITDGLERDVSKVILYRSRDTSYYINIPTTLKTSYGIEMAYENGVTGFMGLANKFEGKSTFSEGITDKINLGESFYPKYVNTNFLYNVVSLGASQMKTKCLIVNTKYGEKRSSSYQRIYARISYLLNYQLADVIAPGGEETDTEVPMYYRFKIEGVTPMSKIGFNIGYHIMGVRRFGSMGFAELGVLPGPQSGFLGRVYVKVGGGFSFSKLFERSL